MVFDALESFAIEPPRYELVAGNIFSTYFNVRDRVVGVPRVARWNVLGRYCGCLLEFIKRRRGDTVIVYLHEAVAHLVEPIFRNVKGRVYLRRVSRKYDAFMPQSMRFAPFSRPPTPSRGRNWSLSRTYTTIFAFRTDWSRE